MNKTLSKLMLDIILTALSILLIYPRQTGFSFHEIAGLASGALVGFICCLTGRGSKTSPGTGLILKERPKPNTSTF
jgi:hypothetical protein